MKGDLRVDRLANVVELGEGTKHIDIDSYHVLVESVRESEIICELVTPRHSTQSELAGLETTSQPLV